MSPGDSNERSDEQRRAAATRARYPAELTGSIRLPSLIQKLRERRAVPDFLRGRLIRAVPSMNWPGRVPGRGERVRSYPRSGSTSRKQGLFQERRRRSRSQVRPGSWVGGNGLSPSSMVTLRGSGT